VCIRAGGPATRRVLKPLPGFESSL
jgi:hypothetical protein